MKEGIVYDWYYLFKGEFYPLSSSGTYDIDSDEGYIYVNICRWAMGAGGGCQGGGYFRTSNGIDWEIERDYGWEPYWYLNRVSVIRDIKRRIDHDTSSIVSKH